MSPETEPTPWELMRVLRDIREDLRDIKKNSITRDEWTATQQGTDRRFEEVMSRVTEWRDASVAEHVALSGRIDAVKKDIDAVKNERVTEAREREAEASKRRFTLAMAVFGAGLSVVTGVLVFIVQGVLSP